jgi:hypothetical protein
MIPRDLSNNVQRRLALECEDEYKQWLELTEGLIFKTREPITQKELWRLAFSKGVSALLKRVDKLKDI